MRSTSIRVRWRSAASPAGRLYQRIRCLDARELKLEDGGFATVYANCVVEHVPEIKNVLQGCYRGLRNGGKLVITVPLARMNRHLLLPWRWYARLRQRQLVHINLLSETSWEDLLRDIGFSDIEFRPYLSGKACKFWDSIDSPSCIQVGRYGLAPVLGIMAQKLLPRWAKQRTVNGFASWLSRKAQADTKKDDACATVVIARKTGRRRHRVIIVHLGPATLPITHQRGGAIQRRMLEIASAQSKRGHRVILYSAVDSLRCSGGGVGGRSANNLSAQTNHREIEIRSIRCNQTGYLRDIEFLIKVRRDLNGQNVDVLHFHSLPEGAALSDGGIAKKKILSYDYFAFRRGKKTPLFWWYRNALRKFSCLLPVSEYCRQSSQEYWDFKDVPVQVSNNGVNLEQFCPDPAKGVAKKKALGIGSGKVILYVGRVCEQKGTDVLIDAFQRLKQKDPSSRLVVAGPADAFGQHGEKELTRRISDCGGLYLGAVEEDQLSAVYNMADIFVMPTREIEMFGMAAVEAQACGKPVVASRHGGLPEVVSERSGLFFSTGDAVELASQISSLLADGELRESLGSAARGNAARFAWPKIVGQLDNIYSQS